MHEYESEPEPESGPDLDLDLDDLHGQRNVTFVKSLKAAAAITAAMKLTSGDRQSTLSELGNNQMENSGHHSNPYPPYLQADASDEVMVSSSLHSANSELVFKPQLQTQKLQQLQDAGAQSSIYLQNGIRIVGRIVAFDETGILIEPPTGADLEELVITRSLISSVSKARIGDEHRRNRSASNTGSGARPSGYPPNKP